MESATPQPASATNTCSNCGGTLEYDFTSNTNKCAYCGSTFKINKPDAAKKDVPDAGCIPYKTDISKFKSTVVKFLSTGDQTPINLLFDAKFLSVEQAYLPFYQFSGTYDGYYNTMDSHGKLVAENTPFNGNFSVSVYGGTDELDRKNAPIFADRADKKLIVPMNSIDTDGIKLVHDAPDHTTWDSFGEQQAAAQVYSKLAQADPSNQHQHFLKYHTQSASKFYYPAWRAVYQYGGVNYPVYMDDQTGELIAGKPVDNSIQPPQRSAVYKKYLLIGLGLWFSMLILRAALSVFLGGKFDNNNHSLNNILFSEIAGLYWVIRGVFFLGIFPLLMLIVFYKTSVANCYAKMARVRDNNIDLLRSGKRNMAFNKTA